MILESSGRHAACRRRLFFYGAGPRSPMLTTHAMQQVAAIPGHTSTEGDLSMMILCTSEVPAVLACPGLGLEHLISVHCAPGISLAIAALAMRGSSRWRPSRTSNWSRWPETSWSRLAGARFAAEMTDADSMWQQGVARVRRHFNRSGSSSHDHLHGFGAGSVCRNEPFL